ncbi:retropepsin-like aspartic protease family protein [Candidatus Electrothrix sp.]|uniref:retropepsin-like aspartic protease family protein n=1 Tax=Candidatus Electrothrix sp. TaxID=2170559 RepID=UPI004055E8AC
MKKENPISPHEEVKKEWSFSDVENEMEDNQADESSLPFGLRFLLIAGGLIGFLVYLNRTFHALSFGEDFGQIIYQGIFILFVSAALASGNTWRKIKQLAAWAAIGLVFMIVFSYRYELAGVRDRLLSEIMPSKGMQNTPDSVTFPVSADGHFYIQAEVNGVPLIFLADTGASDIVLSPGDAKKLGIDLQQLEFNRIYETANGTVRGGSVQLADFKVQGIHLQDVRASVNEAKMSNSLLGMTFFKRLKRYEVKEDKLTLYWNP